MCPVIFAGFVPHPPLLIDGVGDEQKDEAAETDQAYRELAARLCALNPGTVVVITPHGPVFSDAYTMAGWDTLKGDFTPFGSLVSMTWRTDSSYVERAERIAGSNDLPLVALSPRQLASHRHGTGLDHGTMVPLWYLQEAGWKGTVVCVRIGGLPPAQCYALGKVLAQAAEGSETAIIASGDLSHCLTDDAPSPFNSAGAEFDRAIVTALEQNNYTDILSISPDFRQRAAECGWRPLVTLMGALDGRCSRSEVLSYQGPFGVGYLVASFTLEAGNCPSLEFPRSKPANGSPLVKLAREAIRYYLLTGDELDPPELTPPLDQQGGVFVSLKMDDQLRGCIGTIEPEQDNLAMEVIANAISAASADPRFEPVTAEELEELTISVDVLSKPNPARFTELNPAEFGLIAQWQGRRGILLPDLPGVDSPETQLKIVCAKAGIPENKAKEAKLYIFSVERHH